MRIREIVRGGIVLAGLAAGFTQYVKGAPEQGLDRDVGGREVSLKPISTSRLGGDGGNEWLLGAAIAGIGLLGLGGLATAKLLK
jgi:hypothetical protein